LFGRRRGRGEEEGGSGVSVRVWRGGVEGRVVESYRVGISTVSVVERGASLYYVVEDPPVSERDLRRLGSVLERISEELEDPGLFLDVQRREEARAYLRERLGKLGVKSDVLVALAERELLGFGSLDPVLRDKNLENVECKGPDVPLTVFHSRHGRMETNMSFSRGELDRLVQRLVFLSGRTISISSPKVDNAFLPGVGRLTATYGGEISPQGSSFVVRIFPERPWTVLGLLERGTISPELGAYLWLAVEYKMPILVAGEMGSGKTSYANALLGLAPPDKRIGTAEDLPEFKIPHLNWQPLTTEDRRGVTLMDLVALLLRYNVDYVVINEIRGARNQRGEVDAVAWFQAVATGHGGVTTIHADTVEDVFNRLDQMGIPPSYLTSLALVVYIGRFKIGGRIQRRTQYVFDIVDPAKRLYNTIFRYDRDCDCYRAEGLESARTTKRIMELAKWDAERFKAELDRRAEFLRRLLCIHQRKPIVDLRELAEFFARFYRGYMPEVGDCAPAQVGPRQPAAAPRPSAEWVLRFRGPRGRKVYYFEPSPGLVLLNVEGNSRVVEDEVFELYVNGSGELRYRVEMDGREVGRGVLPLVKQAPGGGSGGLVPASSGAAPLAGRGAEAAGAVGEETLVAEETKVVEETLVAPQVGDLCIKFGDGVVKLVDGKVYGRADFGFLEADLASYVSRQHFKSLRVEGRWYLVDLGSKNGLYINGARVEAGGRAEVWPGYRVRVGKAEGVVELC
jgi:flagellar protein FlaI